MIEYYEKLIEDIKSYIINNNKYHNCLMYELPSTFSSWVEWAFSDIGGDLRPSDYDIDEYWGDIFTEEEIEKINKNIEQFIIAEGSYKVIFDEK